MFLSRPFTNIGIGISASALSLESALASASAKNYFCLQNVFFLGRIFIFFLVLSYDISTILLEIIISLGLPFHPFKGVHCCSRKRLFELSEAHVHQWFEKITAPKIFAYFAYFSAKPSRVELCLSAFAGPPGNFPKSSLEQLFCRDPDSL